MEIQKVFEIQNGFELKFGKSGSIANISYKESDLKAENVS